MFVEWNSCKILQCFQLINYDLRRIKSQCFINLWWTSGISKFYSSGYENFLCHFYWTYCPIEWISSLYLLKEQWQNWIQEARDRKEWESSGQSKKAVAGSQVLSCIMTIFICNQNCFVDLFTSICLGVEVPKPVSVSESPEEWWVQVKGVESEALVLGPRNLHFISASHVSDVQLVRKLHASKHIQYE